MRTRPYVPRALSWYLLLGNAFAARHHRTPIARRQRLPRDEVRHERKITLRLPRGDTLPVREWLEESLLDEVLGADRPHGGVELDGHALCSGLDPEAVARLATLTPGMTFGELAVLDRACWRGPIATSAARRRRSRR